MSVSFFGDYDTTETVNIPFNTFDSNDPTASVTITNLVAGDIEIHKDGGTTQRSSDAGVTISLNFDSVTGNHIAHIDLSDNTDAGFYSAGSRYQVRIEGTTVDAGTINAWIGAFSIGCVLRPAVDGRTLGVESDGDLTKVNTLDGHTAQTADNNTILAHADYGNAQLVRSTVPANTLDVNSTHQGGIDLDNTSGTLDAAEFGGDFITADKIANDAIGDEHWNVSEVTTDAASRTASQANVSDIPNTAEFEARTIPALDYVVVGDTLAGVTDVTNQVTADVTAISGDSTAADNLESQYDTTGLAGDTFPATQAQMSNITNTGSAVHTSMTAYTLTTGNETANTEANTKALDGVRHTHTDAGDEMVLEYEFNVGAGTPSSVQITGALTGGNDDLEVMAYDYVAAGYIQIGILEGKVSNANAVYSYDIFTSMVGTGANLGDVKIKLQDGAYTLSSATLYIDQIYVSFSSATGSYNGAIWVNDDVSNTGTIPNIDGIDTNPVSTWAAALTLAASTNIDRFQIANGTAIQLSADSSNFTLIGEEWTLDLNGQVIANMYVEQASIHGTATGTSYRFIRCKIALGNAISVQAGGMNDCAIGASGLTFSAAGTLIMKGCSPVGDSAYIDFEDAAEAKTVQMTPWNGDIELRNFGHSGAVHTCMLTGQGHVTLNANCDDAGANDILDLHGMFHVTDNVGGGWGGTTNEEARIDQAQILNAITDDDTQIDGSALNTLSSHDPGATIGTSTVTTAEVNAQVDLALNTAIPGSPTAASINDYIRRTKYASCNRWDITEANGNWEVFTDADVSFATVAAAFTTLAGVTLRKKLL